MCGAAGPQSRYVKCPGLGGIGPGAEDLCTGSRCRTEVG